MKVGFYFGKTLDANAGGGYTFQQSILNSLVNVNSKHKFYIFADNCNDSEKNGVKFVKLNRYYSNNNESISKRLFLKIPRKIKRLNLERKYKTALNKAVIDNNIELIWFVTPAYEYVDIPYVYTVWDLQHRKQSFFPEVSISGWTFEQREKRYNYVIPRATYVVIGNEQGTKEVKHFYNIPDERIKSLPLPTPDFALKEIESNKDIIQKFNLPDKYLFYPAQFWPHKNHIVILYALKILKEKYNLDYSIVFTGTDKGNLQYIKEKSKALGLQNNVFFLGFVSIEELVQLYKNAFALVFTSFFGPDNIPPLEAFALRCPVICSNYDGAKEQLKDAALFFDPKNEIELAEKIKQLDDNSNLILELIEKGAEIAHSWTSKNYVNGILEIIDGFASIRRCWISDKPYVHL